MAILLWQPFRKSDVFGVAATFLDKSKKMDPMAWIIPYAARFLRLDVHLMNALTRSADQRQWIGMMDAVIALAYNRFRPGSKLKINGFYITNDHRHQIHIMDYTFDFQGFKRTLLGGRSSDMLNLKAPLYFSYQILVQIPVEDRVLLLKLAQESVAMMLNDTYQRDLAAQDLLKALQLILKHLADPEFEPDGTLEEYLCIKPEYQSHPLSQYNQNLWLDHREQIALICQHFREAQTHYFNGGPYEYHLEQVRQLTETVRTKMINYWEDLSHI